MQKPARPATLDADDGEFLVSDLDITHIAIAPDLKIAYVYPEHGNIDALGLDYRTVPSQFSSVQAALNSGTIVVTGPVDLVQGGQGIIARMPIFNEDGSDWGVVSLVIDPDSLFAGIDFNQDPNYHFAFRRSSDEFLIRGAAEVFQADALVTSIGAPTESWQLASYPRDHAWLSSPQPFLYQWLVGIVIISSLLNTIVLRGKSQVNITATVGITLYRQ
ncbi:CHASE domain-containing protein [Pseudidiomarina taiwanensis]|uniref:CHASE domain-containing protein n=1 Tax=Pseudidiomarina taiwanensis TaxID=337250 RepID=UPI003083F13D